MSAAPRIAFRELRGGLKGFRIFLLCLTLGVAGIAAVGSVRTAIERGLSGESAALLGGDAEITFTYRFADETERAWMAENALATSEVADFRSMVTLTRDGKRQRALVQVKGVDILYPLYGSLGLSPDITPKDALATVDGRAGLVAANTLAERLNLRIGDTLRLGNADFRLSAILTSEPDSATGGFAFGPRVIVSLDAAKSAGLVAPGTLFTGKYRLKLPAGTDLETLKTAAETALADRGMQWSDTRDATPSLSRFVERMGAFLVIVGLAGLAVGGVGVSAAVRAYLDAKKPVIATLKTLGASSGTIFGIYLLQIGMLALLGIALGLILGTGLPILLGPLFSDALPVPARFAVYPAPMIEAGTYGLLTAAIFSIWPLGRALNIRATSLFRDETSRTRRAPRWYFILLTAALSALLVASAAWFSGVPKLALWSAFGVILALGALLLTAMLTKVLARRLSRSRPTRGRPVLRLALGAIGGPGGEAGSVILSLGLGLAVLATIGQIDTNMRRAITEELPAVAPSYFFVDIQKDQFEGFNTIARTTEGIDKIQTAPMLRGIISKVNGIPASEALGESWVLEGDRGITYAATPPEGNDIVAGAWWPEDYTGEPQMSFSAHDAGELGLKLGDRLTVNVLGRDLTARVVAFHRADFSSMGINFVMIVDPAALQAAPHSYIATVYGDKQADAPLLDALATAYPNITAIRISDAVERVSRMLNGIASAIRWGAAVTLLTGFTVLIGAAAAGERQRIYEAALLKTLGATRPRILASFALRSAILGGAAGLVAIGAGALAGWAVMTNIMDVAFRLDLPSALLIVSGGALASLLAGLAFAWRPLSARPARVLRARE